MSNSTGWLVIRRRQERPVERPDRRAALPSDVDTAYHAVSIRFGENACNAAREMAGRRFLSSAAPRIPLADCDAADCKCRFVHHKDRRSGKDRRSPFTAGGRAAASGSYARERRDGRERRADD